jgi:hypothetical protein
MLDFAYVCPIEAYNLATPRLIAQDLRRVISTVFRCSRLRLLDCPLYRLLFSVASIWPRTTSTTVTATILSAASTIKSTTKIITLRPHDSRSPVATGTFKHPNFPDTGFRSLNISIVLYRCIFESALLQLSLHRESCCRDFEPLERTRAYKPSDPPLEPPIRIDLSFRVLMEYLRSTLGPAAPIFGYNLDLLAQH